MEMKKSYSPFGSTPLSVDEVLPDIQTGRAVYPDKDKEADASYMERINQYKHEGFHDVSEDGGSSGGSVDCGYSCAEEWVTLTDESVTTTINEGNPFASGEFAYSESIIADTIKVTFNGIEYTCNKRLEDGENFYGAELSEATESFDFSTYPFAIGSSGGSSYLYTETAGTYQVKIETYEKTVETSECFDRARGYSCFESSETLIDGTVVTSYEPKSGITSGNLNFSIGVHPQITVTFDGVEYKCPFVDDYYGSSSNRNFSVYPFQIVQDGTIYTATEGTHSITIMHIDESIETTECFKKAVKSVGGGVMMLNLVESDSLSIEGATWQEALDALASGTMLYLNYRNAGIMPCVFYDATTIAFERVTINNSQVVQTAVVWDSDGTATKHTANYPSNN